MSDYVILDLETTGFSYKQGDRITEIAALKIQNGVVSESFQTLVNPKIYIPSEVRELTGITNEMVVDAPTSRTAIAALLEFIENIPLVAHNASFDGGFLEGELKKIHRENAVPMLCTMLLARRLFPDFTSYKLSSLVDELGLQPRLYHRALADCEATVELLQRLQKQVTNFTPVDYEFTPDNFKRMTLVPPIYYRSNGVEAGIARSQKIKMPQLHGTLIAKGIRPRPLPSGENVATNFNTASAASQSSITTEYDSSVLRQTAKERVASCHAKLQNASALHLSTDDIQAAYIAEEAEFTKNFDSKRRQDYYSLSTKMWDEINRNTESKIRALDRASDAGIQGVIFIIVFFCFFLLLLIIGI